MRCHKAAAVGPLPESAGTGMLLRRQAPGQSRPVPLGDAGNAHRQDDRLLAQRQKRDSGSRHNRSIISILVLPLSPLMQRGDSAEAPPGRPLATFAGPRMAKAER